MGSKPKASEYKASPAEQASAAVAMAENKFFKANYDPLLRDMRDESLGAGVDETLRSRANADTMQTLAGNANYDRAATGDAGGAEAQAYQSQLAQADEAALDIRNKKKLNVLGIARDQAADAQSGMTSAANMGASEVLNDAAAKQQVRSAKTAALGQIGTSLTMQGGKNMQSKGQKPRLGEDGKQLTDKDGKGLTDEVSGSFFSPVDDGGNSISGFKNRLSSTKTFGYGTNPFGG